MPGNLSNNGCDLPSVVLLISYCQFSVGITEEWQITKKKKLEQFKLKSEDSHPDELSKVVSKHYRAQSQALRKKQTGLTFTHDAIVFATVSFIFSAFFLLMAYSTVYSYPWQASWGQADGKITNITRGAKMWRFVHYDYEVNGQNYSAKQGFEFYGHTVAPGTLVKVRYQPGTPAVSVIQTGVNPATIFYLFGGISLFLFFVGFLSNSLKPMLRPSVDG